MIYTDTESEAFLVRTSLARAAGADIQKANSSEVGYPWRVSFYLNRAEKIKALLEEVAVL